MKTLLLTILICLISLTSFAQNDHPIDKSLKECMDDETNFSTLGMKKCLKEAYMKWEAELNKYYNLLMDILDEEAKEKLKQSQLAWIKFRDLEFEFIPDYFQDIGSYIGPTIIEDKVRIIRARASELKAYYETVKNE